MMAYYFKDGSLIKHVIVGISSDTRHDAHLVKVIEAEALKLGAENTTIETVFEWTDGCAAQYKGKSAFADISLSRNIRVLPTFLRHHMEKGYVMGLEQW